MKSIFLSVVLFFSIGLMSQAPVPTSWDVTNINPPMGWSIGVLPGGVSYQPGFYNNNGNVAQPSVKLSGDGHFVQVNIIGEAGEVEFYLRGMTASSNPFQGTFLLEESTNGTSWTTMKTLTNSDIDVSGYTKFLDTLASASRYVRFNFDDKVSGWNLSLDDIRIGNPLPKPEAEINIVEGIDTIFSGENFYTSENANTTKRINFIVQNQGTDSTLRISNTSITGSPEFTLVSSPSSVMNLSTDTIKVDFTPTASGTFNSTLTILSNDANEGTYVINLVGFGNGLASEPTNPASALTFSNITSFEFDASFTASTDADKYLILRRNGGAPTGTPADNQEYKVGEWIGDGKVIYAGPLTNLTDVRNVYSDEVHHLAIFPYNGFDQYANYMTTPLTGNVTLTHSMQPSNYYTGVSTSSNSFTLDLQGKISPHTRLFYNDFEESYIEPFASYDTVIGGNQMRALECHYTSDIYIYSVPFTYAVFSREHTWPQTWMPTNSLPTDTFESLREYSDYHNLFPVNQNDANGVRSNLPLGEVVTVTSTFKDGTYGEDASGNDVYEPRDEHKGDAARAIFYMATRYHLERNNSWALPNPISIFVSYGQNQDVLKKWHWDDPVDSFERSRNDFIASIQGNRNPFVDSMHYACNIDFTTMNKVSDAAPCRTTPNASIDELEGITNLKLYPNPSKGLLNIEFDNINNENFDIQITDALGRVVLMEKDVKGNTQINLSNYNKGIYIVEFMRNNNVVKSQRVAIH